MPNIMILGKEVVLPYYLEYMGREFTLTDIKFYGRAERKFFWQTNCQTCGVEFRFQTRQWNAYMHRMCKKCEKATAETEKERVARERMVEHIPSCTAIYRAFEVVGPFQCSLAENAPRRIHGPSVLRAACPDLLSEFSLAEIREGIKKAQAHSYLVIAKVGKRPRCGNLIEGWAARPYDKLKAKGLVLDDEISVENTNSLQGDSVSIFD